MDDKLKEVIKRIQGLQALSKSSNPAEAAVAAAIASKLIDKHRISEMQLEVDTSQDPLAEDTDYVYQTGRLIPWKSSLISVLAAHYGVSIMNDITKATGRKVSRYKMFGRKSDMQIVRYMFGWLLYECQRLSDIEAKGKGHVYVFSYCDGFVNGVSLKLQESRAELKREYESSALVKLDSRAIESKNFMHQMNPFLRSAKNFSQSQRDIGAFILGQAQGKNVQINAALNGKS